MSTKSSRIEWIDSEKGFVLLLVCMFHLEVFSFLPSCRMPIFFFLSGLLFSNRRYHSFSQYIKRKWDTLLKPYFILCFLTILLYPKLYDGSTMPGMENSWVTSALNSIGIPTFFLSFLTKFYIFFIDIFMGHSSPTSVGLWFVYSLFQISCVFYLIHRLLSKRESASILFIVLGCACLVLGWFLSYYNIFIPFKIPTMITGLGFYTIGYVSKKNLLNPPIMFSGWSGILVIFVLLILFVLCNMQIDEIIVYRLNQLPHSLWGYILSSISGTYLITFLFLIIGNLTSTHLSVIVKPIIHVFQFIAENGLVILAVHLWALCWFNYLFGSYKEYNWYTFVSLLWVLLFIGASIPIFNKYLYWAIGKKMANNKEA